MDDFEKSITGDYESTSIGAAGAVATGTPIEFHLTNVGVEENVEGAAGSGGAGMKTFVNTGTSGSWSAGGFSVRAVKKPSVGIRTISATTADSMYVPGNRGQQLVGFSASSSWQGGESFDSWGEEFALVQYLWPSKVSTTTGGYFVIYEGGSKLELGTLPAYPGDSYELWVNAQGKVEYFHNSKLVHTSNREVRFPLHAAFAFRDSGSKWKDTTWVHQRPTPPASPSPGNSIEFRGWGVDTTTPGSLHNLLSRVGQPSTDPSKTSFNSYSDAGTSVGSWGGTCTCPDGSTYDVGDNMNDCASLACSGGTSGTCMKVAKESRNGKKAICAKYPFGAHARSTQVMQGPASSASNALSASVIGLSFQLPSSKETAPVAYVGLTPENTLPSHSKSGKKIAYSVILQQTYIGLARLGVLMSATKIEFGSGVEWGDTIGITIVAVPSASPKVQLLVNGKVKQTIPWTTSGSTARLVAMATLSLTSGVHSLSGIQWVAPETNAEAAEINTSLLVEAASMTSSMARSTGPRDPVSFLQQVENKLSKLGKDE